MLDFQQMIARLVLALILGALLGLEREIVGKEAGIRTEMLVAGGASIFTMIAIVLPYIVSADTSNLADVIARNSGFTNIIANIVVGVGFLGAGLIIHTREETHVHGVTTAALVWVTAAVGILVGLGLFEFATIAAIIMSGMLYILRKLDVSERIERYETKRRRVK